MENKEEMEREDGREKEGEGWRERGAREGGRGSEQARKSCNGRGTHPIIFAHAFQAVASLDAAWVIAGEDGAARDLLCVAKGEPRAAHHLTQPSR